MTFIPGVLRVDDPDPARAVAVLADSPHSGRLYPADFCYACPKSALEVYEDRYVDELLDGLPAIGATVVTALAPRCYIDLNRARDDISPRVLRDGWRGTFPLRPTSYSARGVGLIWYKSDNQLIYDRLPGAEDVMARIQTYYDPYYAALRDRGKRLRARFGRFYHLNMHSMPPTTNGGRTDIVLGDLGGQSCSPEFLDVVASGFRAAGLHVGINTPYRGARLTELFGRPGRQSESVQIEISKGLYLKPDLLTREDAGMARLRRVMEDIVETVGGYALSKTSSKADFRAPSRSSIDTRLPSAASDVTP